MNNTFKTILSTLLLVFVSASLLYWATHRDGPVQDKPGQSRPDRDDIATVDGVAPDWAVYYFYNDVYCTTCEKLENYALETLKTQFTEDLASGKLQWQALDMTASENEHYVMDYKLYSKSVVLVAFDQGKEQRWENLTEIWDLAHDKAAYMAYVETHLRNFMGTME